jgi:hypothetical protein
MMKPVIRVGIAGFFCLGNRHREQARSHIGSPVIADLCATRSSVGAGLLAMNDNAVNPTERGLNLGKAAETSAAPAFQIDH